MLRVGSGQAEGIRFGLIWMWQELLGRRLVGHTGIVPGLTNGMWANENRTLGAIILSNGDVTVGGEQSVTVSSTLVRVAIDLFECFEWHFQAQLNFM